jgi:hypothetical protein
MPNTKPGFRSPRVGRTVMKVRILLPLTLLAVMAAMVYGCKPRSEGAADEDEGDQAISAKSRVERGTNGETVVNLDLATQKLIGLEMVTLEAAEQSPQVEGYGRVLDPSPLVRNLSEVASARVTLEASEQEYQRLKGLFDQGQNASAKALENASAVVKRDRIALRSAEAELMTAWGEPIAGRPDLAAFVGSLARLERVLVRLDLPAGQSPVGPPTGAQLHLPGVGAPVEASYLGPAPATDPRVQGEGFLFEVTNPPAGLTPGRSVTGFLQLPGGPRRGVVVPEAAVVRSAGRAWVYAQTGDTTFARREIALDDPAARGWFVTRGLAPGARLVVTGAQTLLSEERKTEIRVGD